MTEKEIKIMLESHKNYVSTNGQDGTKADLWGADLRGADLWGADLWGAKGICCIENEYPYLCYGYICKNKKRVRFGCYDRTVEEWENDFWNNDKEFPKNSYLGKIRKANFVMIKIWFDTQEVSND